MVIKTELSSFVEFLLEKNIFQSGISFLIATQVNQYSRTIIDTIVEPILDTVVDKDFRDKTLLVGPIEFKIGELIMATINFFIVIIFLFYLYRITKPDGFIQNIISRFT